MSNFILIAGPCVIESQELLYEVAEKLVMIRDKFNIDVIFKASFDKANRTSLNSFRGFGMIEGLEMLKKVKKSYGLKILSDIHESYQAEIVKEYVDYIQIPAFLCRQTDLLIAAGRTGLPINVKKAQFLSGNDMKYAIEKIESTGNKNIFLCERGNTFGYNNLIVDFTNIIEMKKLGYPVIFDATHSVQKPGGLSGKTGGNREYVPYLAKAAIVCGIDGLFIETHPNPEIALSDGPNMIYLADLETLIEKILSLREAL